MTLLLCQAGLNLVKKTSQRGGTVTVSGWFEHCPEDKSRDDTFAMSGWFEPRPEDKSKI